MEIQHIFVEGETNMIYDQSAGIYVKDEEFGYSGKCYAQISDEIDELKVFRKELDEKTMRKPLIKIKEGIMVGCNEFRYVNSAMLAKIQYNDSSNWK
jgi:hypothetical protein